MTIRNSITVRNMFAEAGVWGGNSHCYARELREREWYRKLSVIECNGYKDGQGPIPRISQRRVLSAR